MKFNQFLATLSIVIIFLTGCSLLNNVVYRPVINQGNYVTKSQIDKLQLGQSKEQVVFIMGSPMLHSVFNGNIWYYVFREQSTRKPALQKTYKLIFDVKNRLISFKEMKKERDNQVNYSSFL